MALSEVIDAPASEPPLADDPRQVVYTSESLLRHPGRLLREIADDLWRSRELVLILFVRDLRAHYRQSLLGYAWIFFMPLATSAVSIRSPRTTGPSTQRRM